MPGRRNIENRCGRCRIYLPLCVCPVIPRLELQTRILVIMHARELRLTTNTARLACLALSNSEIRIRGQRALDPGTADPLVDLGENPVLLYPGMDSIELTPEAKEKLPKPLALIVPDGSWHQSRKLANRIKDRGLRSVALPAGAPSDYRLRHASQAGHLSTFEAIARAIGILESPEAQTQLEALFLTMVERRLWSQGKLPASRCRTVIPQAAIEAMRAAGRAGGAKPAC